MVARSIGASTSRESPSADTAAADCRRCRSPTIERIDTTLVLNSGIYNVPGSGRSRIQVEKAQLARLHGPTLYLTGGPSDVAHPNATDDVARIDRVPVFFGSLPVGHGGTFSAPDGGEWARVSARWLDWQLKGNADASRDVRWKGLWPLHGFALDDCAEAAARAGRTTSLTHSAFDSYRHSAPTGAPARWGNVAA